MKQVKLFCFFNTFIQDISRLNPTKWAQESLLVLEENTVMLPLVNQQFSTELKDNGEQVYAFRPTANEPRRKAVNDEITVDDVAVERVPVKLNFHIYDSFIIRDSEQSKSFWDLRTKYLAPTIQKVANEIDEIIAGSKYYFYKNMVGNIGTSLTKTSLININLALNENNAPLDMERYFVMTPQQQADLQDETQFMNANTVGDDGSALRMGSLGQKYGLWNVMSQNMRAVPTGNTIVTGAVDNGAGQAVGDTAITVDGFTAAIVAGSWLTIAGDARPRRVVSTVGGATPTTITLEIALTTAVADDAVITVYTPGAVNLTGGYDADYTKALTVDGYAIAAKRGQLLSVNATGYPYGTVGTPTTTSYKLSRGLDAAALNNAVAAPGPAGQFGFAFHRDAVAFVSHPMQLPPEGTGAIGAIASTGDGEVDENGIETGSGLVLRVTMAYDYKKQGTVVTVDLLCGIAILDENLGTLVMS